VPFSLTIYNIENLKDRRFKLHGNIDRLVDEVKDAKVAVIDGAKQLIEGEYIKPSIIKAFGDDLLKAMQKGNFTVVLTWQVRKPHQNTMITPGDLFELKGAADLVEDATFVLLPEKEPSRPLGKGQWYHPPDDHLNLYVGKAKEADQEFTSPFKELKYEKAKCEFKQR